MSYHTLDTLFEKHRTEVQQQQKRWRDTFFRLLFKGVRIRKGPKERSGSGRLLSVRLRFPRESLKPVPSVKACFFFLTHSFFAYDFDEKKARNPCASHLFVLFVVDPRS